MRSQTRILLYSLLAYFVATTIRLFQVALRINNPPSKYRRPALDLKRYRNKNSTSCQDIQSLNIGLSFRDPTVELSPCLHRPWLERAMAKSKSMESTSRSVAPPPTVKILLTDFGWNSETSLQFPRSIRSRELLQALVDHPLFDATAAWDSVAHDAVPSLTRYYVFLDVETCFETNYPTFGLTNYQSNFDTQSGRSFEEKEASTCYDIATCHYIDQVLQSPLFRYHDATLLYFDCRGHGVPAHFRHRTQPSTQLSLVSLASSEGQLLPSIDQGLPPPFNVTNSQALSHQQIHSINSCKWDRPYLLSFVGELRDEALAAAMFRLHNPSQNVHILTPTQVQRKFQMDSAKFNTLSRYVIVPREDTLFSYRFVPALAAGTIPVVYADHWVWPFRPELVDWSKCAIRIPEDRISETPQTLSRITLQDECERRKYCYHVYQQLLSHPSGVLDGILQGLENTKAMG